MKNVKKFISENKTLILSGVTIVVVSAIALIGNNSEFMKGCRELMDADREGRLETDF
jgi:hypothetical protein